MTKELTRYETGSQALVEHLQQWGIKQGFGTTGGAIVHLLNQFVESRYEDSENSSHIHMRSLIEYPAGFAPIGYYLASGKIAFSIGTTGAAEKLLSVGMSDARFMRVPALYLLPLNNKKFENMHPMQDVSPNGMNLIESLRNEFREDVFVVKEGKEIEDALFKVANTLSESRPAILLFYPDVLLKPITMSSVSFPTKTTSEDKQQIETLLTNIRDKGPASRIVIYVCSEAAYDKSFSDMIIMLATTLNAAVICSVNGLNALDKDFINHYGSIGLGHSDKAQQLLADLNEDDLLLCLGLDVGEYSLNCEQINAGKSWVFTAHDQGYAMSDESYQQHFKSQCELVHGKIAINLRCLLQYLERENITLSSLLSLNQLRNKKYNVALAAPDCVDVAEFYLNLQSLWRPGTIGFEDASTVYRDRQKILEVMHENIKIFTAHDGSALGNAFGLGVGAKVAKAEKDVLIFAGDGGWQYFAGAMPSVADLGVIVFIFNNGGYALVKEYVRYCQPELEQQYQHTDLQNIDFCASARTLGWCADKILPDLSNLSQVYGDAILRNSSTLIELPIDARQIYGENMRYANLSAFT